MAVVSISEAATLTGKNRSTLHRHIATGKLSRVANGDGLDTAELIRVYGALKNVALQHVAKEGKQHEETYNATQNVADLEKDKKHLQELLDAKNAHISSLEKQNAVLAEALKSTSLLIEDQRQKTPPTLPEAPQKEAQKGFFKRFFNL